MPKGVEHNNGIFTLMSTRNGVESLMPKGVEHSHIRKSLQLGLVCRISDAERRWAQFEFCGYLHSELVSNLWCRKALSTHSLFLFFFFFSLCRISDAERRWAQYSVDTEINQVNMCRISDAERRWALPLAISVCVGVAVSNLWCRKALSTESHCFVFESIRMCRISDAERRWALAM